MDPWNHVGSAVPSVKSLDIQYPPVDSCQASINKVLITIFLPCAISTIFLFMILMPPSISDDKPKAAMVELARQSRYNCVEVIVYEAF